MVISKLDAREASSMGLKKISVFGLLTLSIFSIACTSNDESHLIQLQATVLAMSMEEQNHQPFPTYTPLPTYTPVPPPTPETIFVEVPIEVIKEIELAPEIVERVVVEEVEVIKEVEVEVIKEVEVEVEVIKEVEVIVEVIKEVEVIVEVTPTPTPSPTPTPTPIGHPEISSQSGISSFGNSGLQGVLSSRMDNPADFDKFQFYGYSGQTITLTMSSGEFDTKLDFLDANEVLITRNDDHGGGTNAYITRELSADGLYIILAQSATLGTNDFGNYSLNFYLTPRN